MIARALLVLALLLPSSASGSDREPQVVGGEPVTAGEFPFLVRIIVPGGYCTGSLIRSNWVVTAAHCGLAGAPTGVSIGDTVPGFLGAGHVVPTLAVAEWVPHPDYNAATNQNDIALIRLGGNAFQSAPRLNGTALYQPEGITLATAPASAATGIGPSIVAGFGRLDSGNAAEVSNWAIVPTHSLQTCNAVFGPLDGAKQLCFGSYPNACQGDSGGPVFQYSGTTALLGGVVSFGLQICGIGPTVATYVPAYVAWINQQIDGTTPASPIKYGWELPQSAQDGVATGVSNAQGWAFSTAGTITSIRLERNGQHFATLPCCSERGDVQSGNPGAPVLSGFSAAINWGLLGDGTSNLTLVIRDSAGNERRDTRSVKSVQVLDGRPFVSGLGFTQSTFCQLFTQGGRAFAECSGLSFQQGTCNGDITFGWQTGKQAFEVVEGCH